MYDPDPNPTPTKPRLQLTNTDDGSGPAKIVYVLYLLFFLTGVITPIIGVVVAYVYTDDAPDWLRSHYQFQIRTFWIGLVLFIVGSLLALVLIGWLVLLFATIWWIVRCVKGLRAAHRREPIPDVQTWLW